MGKHTLAYIHSTLICTNACTHKHTQRTNLRRPRVSAVPLGCVVVMVSRLCSSVTPNTALLQEEVGKGGGMRRICQSMSDPPNPQVRQELYDGRLSQARQRKTHTRTSDPRQRLTSSLRSELISCVTGEERHRCPLFGSVQGFIQN